MTPDDPLIRLLQTADVVAGSVAPPVDLPDQVRRRHSRQVAGAKRLKIGLSGVAASVLVVVAIYHGQSPVEPGLIRSWVVRTIPRGLPICGPKPTPLVLKPMPCSGN